MDPFCRRCLHRIPNPTPASLVVAMIPDPICKAGAIIVEEGQDGILQELCELGSFGDAKLLATRHWLDRPFCSLIRWLLTANEPDPSSIRASQVC